jgi:hypothetical protein
MFPGDRDEYLQINHIQDEKEEQDNQNRNENRVIRICQKAQIMIDFLTHRN